MIIACTPMIGLECSIGSEHAFGLIQIGIRRGHYAANSVVDVTLLASIRKEHREHQSMGTQDIVETSFMLFRQHCRKSYYRMWKQIRLNEHDWF